MTDKEFVLSIYPDAREAEYYINDKNNEVSNYYVIIHSDECGELLHEDTKWGRILPPQSSNDAWQEAVKYINNIILKKLMS